MIINADATPGHILLPALWARLEADAPIEVPRQHLYPTQRCYWNVLDHLAKSGGKIVTGWQILDVPGVYLWAYHHAVWERPDGGLVDITTIAEQSMGNGPTVFCADKVQLRDFRYPPAKLPVYQPLHYDPQVQQFISKDLMARELERANTKEMIALGWPFHPDRGFSQQPLTPTLDQRSHASRQLYGERNKLLPYIQMKQREWLNTQGPAR